MLSNGIYESMITQLLEGELSKMEKDFYIEKKRIDPAEAAEYLSRFLSRVLYVVFDSLPNQENRLAKQVELSNALIDWLSNRLKTLELSDNLLQSEGTILTALFESQNPIAADLKTHAEKIRPLTGLTQSELFTGSNVGLSLDSEIKREIMSADEICWLVSFIKWTGIRIFKDYLEQASRLGKKIRVITTSYMGATDEKAVEFLAGLPNAEVRLSYNTDRERLHAKAYLFLRKSGFDTGYIGSSNMSRSALTNGLEWNMKITTQEIPHVIQKFKSTFETYWSSTEFEPYCKENESHRIRLKKALQAERSSNHKDEATVFFDIEPHAYQKAILDQLISERENHQRFKNLLVAATGTGKTVISAFDFRRYYRENPSINFLYVAHREEILTQARTTYRSVIRNSTFGELWVGRHEPEHYDQLFVSVQKLNNRLEELKLSETFYDFIVVDEVHHIAADSYRPILKRFSPMILVGLTATPERHDGADILADFCNTIAAELRLPDAINQRHLCPFQYFGVDDPIDLSNVEWVNGRYLPAELTRIYTANDQRVSHILRSMDEVLDDIQGIRALGFCVSQDHAQFMSQKFNLKGINSAVLTSLNSAEREVLRNQLVSGKINVLFVVDIFNEGVDIPEVDTLLFLRPTESLTVFLQQLGRGLRLSEGKDCLTVLDFVGNARAEYDFGQKFRALVGKSHHSVIEEVHNDFPHLPLGCSIVLQKQARTVILNNIKNAIVNQRKLISYLKSYKHQTSLPLNVSNFLRHYPNVSLEDIYKSKNGKEVGWTRLCEKAGIYQVHVEEEIEKAVVRGISNRLLQCSSRSYLEFILQVFSSSGIWNISSVVENQFANMMHYDFWQKSGPDIGFDSLQDSVLALVSDEWLAKECIEVVSLLLDQLDVSEKPMNIGYPIGLNVYARYSRDQILAAFRKSHFEKKFTSREGMVEIKHLNTEVLFVTLQKTAKKFSPTTLYHDYAINEHLFHWQSQNSARPDKGKGLSYIKHQETGKTIILFVREQPVNEFGRTMGFVNLGPVKLETHSGSQPMNITWRLDNPIPSSLWAEAAKLAVG